MEPWGSLRADMHAGVIASTIVNSQPYRKRGAKLFTYQDFAKCMPSFANHKRGGSGSQGSQGSTRSTPTPTPPMDNAGFQMFKARVVGSALRSGMKFEKRKPP